MSVKVFQRVLNITSTSSSYDPMKLDKNILFFSPCMKSHAKYLKLESRLKYNVEKNIFIHG